MTTNCNLTSGLYCLPEANQTLMESGSYDLLYNADFASLHGQSQVDVYLYNAENSSLVAKVASQPNSGEFSFSVTSQWFSEGPSSTAQYTPFQWYVVAAGQTFNVAPSSATYGPVFYAEQTPLGSSSGGSSLPIGAIIGIVVAVLIVFGACIGGLFFLRKTRKPEERMKLDSESDLPPPKDGDEKSIFKDMTSAKRGSHTTDFTHYDVPLAFSGGAPDTPRSSAVPVDVARLYVGPRPSTAQSTSTSKSSLDYGKGARNFSPHDNIPPSPKLPNGVLSAGWQSGPSQRSQQNPAAVPPPRGPTGQTSAFDRPSQLENGGQPQPLQTQKDPFAGRPPVRNQPPYPQDPRSQPVARPPIDQQRMPQQAGYPQGQPPYPQGQSPYPQGQQAARIPQPPVPRPQYDQRPPSRNQQEPPRSPRSAAPPPMLMTQPPSPQKAVEAPTPARKPVNVPYVPVVVDRGPPVLPKALPVEIQPVATFSRQNSRRGQIPPFPLDPLTRKPTVTKKAEEVPMVKIEAPKVEPPKESEADIPSDSEETPLPQKIEPITPSVIPAIKVAEYRRPPSAKSQTAKMGSTSSIAIPPSPTKPVAATAPSARLMGAGFEGASAPKSINIPTVNAIPTVSTIPPSPSPTAIQFTKEMESPRKPEPNTLAPAVPKPDDSGSVTADILRMSVATDASARTSMLVEAAASTRDSLGASTTFETEGTTAPLMIAKKDSPVVKKAVAPVIPEEVRSEVAKPATKPTEFEFRLPALEQGSFFNFEDLE